MADLSYSDVQRAVQDGLGNVRNDLQRIVNDMGGVAQASQRIDDIEREVIELQRMVQNLQTNLTTMRPGGNVEQRIMTLANDVTELKHRFVAVEKFATQMSDYMRTRYDEEREDRQYRSA